MTVLQLCLLLLGNFIAGIISFILYAKFDDEYEPEIDVLWAYVLFGYLFLPIILLILFLELVKRFLGRFI